MGREPKRETPLRCPRPAGWPAVVPPNLELLPAVGMPGGRGEDRVTPVAAQSIRNIAVYIDRCANGAPRRLGPATPRRLSRQPTHFGSCLFERSLSFSDAARVLRRTQQTVNECHSSAFCSDECLSFRYALSFVFWAYQTRFGSPLWVQGRRPTKGVETTTF